MPTYCTEFSCLLNVGSAENAAAAVEFFNSESVMGDGECRGYCFDMEVVDEEGPGSLWIYSEASCDPEDVEHFALRCARAFKLKGTWSFSWATTCTRPVLDAFGGGAIVLDLGAAELLDRVDTASFMYELEDDPPAS